MVTGSPRGAMAETSTTVPATIPMASSLFLRATLVEDTEVTMQRAPRGIESRVTGSNEQLFSEVSARNDIVHKFGKLNITLLFRLRREVGEA